MTVEERLERIDKQLQEIAERNARVEADKAWETSQARLLAISAITYVSASLLLFMLGSQNFYLAALVPVLGFILSAQTLPFLKSRWLRSKSQESDRL